MTLFDAPTVRVRLLVAYDGSAFHGFALNRDVPTVAGALGGAISRVLGHEVVLTAAGRTDTGVHAWGQVVSFDAPADGLDLARLQRSVNGLCGPVDRGARGGGGRARLRRPLLGPLAPLPLHGPERGRSRPLPRGDDVARRGAARPAGPPAGLRSAHRRARLLVVLPAPEAGGGRAARDAGPPGRLGAVGRGRRARPAAAALRDHGQRLLPPDGPLHRRHAGRGGPGQALGRLDHGDAAGPRPRHGRPAGARPRPLPLGGRLPT